MTKTKLREGDVLDYTIDRNERWCKEGQAIVREYQGEVRAVDTYWSTSGDEHVLSDSEIASAELRFRLKDFEELERYVRGVPTWWSDRRPEDRRTITSQHGLTVRYFIRIGSEPDPATMRAELVDRMDEAARQVRSAENALAWAQDRLHAFDAANSAASSA